MTTKDDDAARAKQAADKKPETTQGRGARGEVDKSGTTRDGEAYDPTQDPTFNMNSAQRFEEPGRAGSQEAEDANEEVS